MAELDIAVIGGGAAGFFGAIICAATHPHVRVTLLEATRQPLSKVRISGGGRCNVTHACFDPNLLVQNYPRGGKALRGAFSRFQPQHMVAWLAEQGVQLKTESDGRMFPITDNSETIIDCLMWAAKQAGVSIRTSNPVAAVNRIVRELVQDGDRELSPKTGFEIELKSGEILQCDRLLMATGSHPQGYQIAAALGHQLVPPVPSLFTFNIADHNLHALAGLSVDPVKLQLLLTDGSSKSKREKPLEQTGALLITHWGLSGPAVLKLSAWGARLLYEHRYQVNLRVNWLPQSNLEETRRSLIAAKEKFPKRAIVNYCPFTLPHRLWEYLITRAKIKPDLNWADVSHKVLSQLGQELTEGIYEINGKGAFKEEFVTCGGVNLTEVDFKTMESRCCPGLYLAGEILDIDGVTGGFNFQSAWTTAWLAGRAMGEMQMHKFAFS